VNIRWRERTNKMQLIRCLLSNFLSQHVSGIIMPIIRRKWPRPIACGVLSGCVGCGWLWSCGTHDAAPQDHNKPQATNPGRTPHAVGRGIFLLMMGIMMPETCWDRKFDNKHRISCILLVLSLHLKIYVVTIHQGSLNVIYLNFTIHCVNMLTMFQYIFWSIYTVEQKSTNFLNSY